ncbi:SOS response-associated peptidase [Devosia sp.]|uniref:SOS response-associated peptidase n=1 Tax=Devosia sp. TaxID=1871048 RepID=UPI001A0575EE|nr:SOS response-associated peptidase [Devosia sp.]MBE0580019.1 SOS response-associated peptidase [Devosia sp.]
MCGRFTNEMTWAEIHALYSLSNELFPLGPPSNLQPRYNIAPTQTIDFVQLDKGGNREFHRGRWGLVPFFAKEVGKLTTFNARIETVDTSGVFRESFKRRRALIPADGYFEWTTNAEDGKKDPWHLQLPGGEGFSFAGLAAHNDNLELSSCTIITAPALPHIEHIHTRMPLIIPQWAYDRWLSAQDQGDEAKGFLLSSQIDSQLVFHRVDRAVGNSRYEGTDTKKPILNSL